MRLFISRDLSSSLPGMGGSQTRLDSWAISPFWGLRNHPREGPVLKQCRFLEITP